jgi:hypothetical protein
MAYEKAVAANTRLSIISAWGASPTDGTPSADYRGAADLQRIICEGRAWSCDWALRVVGCESGGDALAVGQEWYEGELWYFVGLWQIATRDPAMIPVLQDPVRNTAEAEWKYNNGGTSHWPVCGLP